MSKEMLRVLVVDDHSEVRGLLETVLVSEGCLTVSAKDGYEAVAVAERFRPHVVFLDVKMPVLDGFGALAELRELLPAVEVVMMTAYPEVETVNRAFKEGAVGFLGKPFDMAVVRAVLREIAAKKYVGSQERLDGSMWWGVE
ncbi:MAG: response regulator [Bacillota bacterium]